MVSTAIRVHGQRAVDVMSGSTSDRANLIQYTYGNADNQHWRLEAVGGAFEISTCKSAKLVDVLDASTADNAQVVQWADLDRPDQRRQLIDAGNGYSGLRNVNSGKVLAVSGSSTAVSGSSTAVGRADRPGHRHGCQQSAVAGRPGGSRELPGPVSAHSNWRDSDAKSAKQAVDNTSTPLFPIAHTELGQ
ncbi:MULTISPECIES: RICIN domain-containing protein [unclassified Saccharothrix]|uniref:RICIN domain-containing protein n=1 Tax=unclassified Saccharothrix TaxID=2593673 RepID=UPI00307F3916